MGFCFVILLPKQLNVVFYFAEKHEKSKGWAPSIEALCFQTFLCVCVFWGLLKFKVTVKLCSDFSYFAFFSFTHLFLTYKMLRLLHTVKSSFYLVSQLDSVMREPEPKTVSKNTSSIIVTSISSPSILHSPPAFHGSLKVAKTVTPVSKELLDIARLETTVLPWTLYSSSVFPPWGLTCTSMLFDNYGNSGNVCMQWNCMWAWMNRDVRWCVFAL